MSKDGPMQPRLAQLLAGYLNRQAQMPAEDAEAEVVAYDAGPVHAVEPQLAWSETLVVARCYSRGAGQAPWPAPPGWGALVAAQEPAVGLACALGNFPQMVRHFHLLLQCRQLSQLRPAAGPFRPVNVPAAVEWARQTAEKSGADGQHLLALAALGLLRLARDFDEAERLFEKQDAQVPDSMRPAWENEKGALAWHCGQAERAYGIWQRLDQSPEVLFNKGMAELFLDRSESAQNSLKMAVAGLPEEGAWLHLARLYLTLAQIR